MMVLKLLILFVATVVAQKGTPVIFDTDIGTDFDDSAAIALALSDPTLDVQLIVVTISRLSFL